MLKRTGTALTLAAAWSAAALAGPITPPPGPVSSTPGPEPRIAINATNTPGDADSIYKITAAGSYYLAGNVSGASGFHGIQITASNVTLDLNGFALIGTTGSLDGVNIATSRGVNIVVKNGAIRSWGDCGIEMEYNAGNPPQGRIERIQADNNGRSGILTEFNCEIVDCVASENAAYGFAGGPSSIYKGSTARFNGSDGFYTQSAASVSNCIANSNTGRGFSLSLHSVAENCTAESNGIGFTAQGSLIRGCIASNSDDDGFDLFEACTITDSNAYRNTGHGIDGSNATIVSRCNVTSNDGDGIQVNSGSTVSECVARSNGLSGIQATSATLIINNQCTANGQDAAGGAGIQVSSSDNRIEGNNCTSQDYGIRATSGGNVIVRNSCSGNTTQWDFVANNYYGPIINRVGVATAAVSGTSASSTLGSTDANANYTY